MTIHMTTSSKASKCILERILNVYSKYTLSIVKVYFFQTKKYSKSSRNFRLGNVLFCIVWESILY